MSMIGRFAEYAAAFETAYESDDWSPIEAYFTEDAVYDSGQGPEAAVEGRAALLGRLKTSVDSFDRRLDSREISFSGHQEQGDTVSVSWKVRYTKAGAPDLVISGREAARFSGDRIELLSGEFDDSASKALQEWMEKHGGLLAGDQ